jgi:hypothetical protein
MGNTAQLYRDFFPNQPVFTQRKRDSSPMSLIRLKKYLIDI